jgi:photosystem II stability/assembly factor-like uncharacterized protein
VVITTTDGSTWTSLRPPAGAFDVSSVTCSSAVQCTAIVNDGTNTYSATTSNFGQSWQSGGLLPTFFAQDGSVWCGPSACLVAGYVPIATDRGGSAVALSIDGGETWSLASVPTGGGALHGATCASLTFCIAVGGTNPVVSGGTSGQGELLRSTDGGHTWVKEVAPAGVDLAYDVACPSPLLCVMVGTKWAGDPAVAAGAVVQSVDGGQTFAPSALSYVPLNLAAVSCPTEEGCIAVGGQTLARIAARPVPLPPAPVLEGHGRTR